MHQEECNNRCNPIPRCCDQPTSNDAANAFQNQCAHGIQKSRLTRTLTGRGERMRGGGPVERDVRQAPVSDSHRDLIAIVELLIVIGGGALLPANICLNRAQ
jgi:hypothetical protein